MSCCEENSLHHEVSQCSHQNPKKFQTIHRPEKISKENQGYCIHAIVFKKTKG